MRIELASHPGCFCLRALGAPGIDSGSTVTLTRVKRSLETNGSPASVLSSVAQT